MMKILLCILFLMQGFGKEVDLKMLNLYRVFPLTGNQTKALSTLVNNTHYQFRSPLNNDGQLVGILVDAVIEKSFITLLEDNFIAYEKIEDENSTLADLSNDKVKSGEISFTSYNRHVEINSYLNRLADTYSDIAKVETIGESFEGRSLKVIQISTNSSANKPIIFIDAAMHAREWISPPVALYVIHKLLEESENLYLLENVDWHILPVVNPDGYEYTHKNYLTRMWRKSRSQVNNCFGADINRNFDFHWSECDSSSCSDECNRKYHGPRPASENETVALINYMLKIKDNFKLYISFHSYGPLILYPWGYTTNLPEDYDVLHAVGEMVSKSIENVRGTMYGVGPLSHTLYICSGTSIDWVKGVLGVNMAYIIELPEGGVFNFNPPPSDILPVVEETWEGVKMFHQYISTTLS